MIVVPITGVIYMISEAVNSDAFKTKNIEIFRYSTPMAGSLAPL